MLGRMPPAGGFFRRRRMNAANNPVLSYIQSSIAELRKVTWPTRREVVSHTALVLAVTAAVALVFAGFDALLNLGLAGLLQLVP